MKRVTEGTIENVRITSRLVNMCTYLYDKNDSWYLVDKEPPFKPYYSCKPNGEVLLVE